MALLPALRTTAMTSLTKFFGIALAAAALSSETRMPDFFYEMNNEQQPGLLRVSGIDDNDRVFLDGELIGDGRRLLRFKNKLLVNPGQYTITILSADNRTTCSYPISIRENETAIARCDGPGPAQNQEVD